MAVVAARAPSSWLVVVESGATASVEAVSALAVATAETSVASAELDSVGASNGSSEMGVCSSLVARSFNAGGASRWIVWREPARPSLLSEAGCIERRLTSSIVGAVLALLLEAIFSSVWRRFLTDGKLTSAVGLVEGLELPELSAPLVRITHFCFTSENSRSRSLSASRLDTRFTPPPPEELLLVEVDELLLDDDEEELLLDDEDELLLDDDEEVLWRDRFRSGTEGSLPLDEAEAVAAEEDEEESASVLEDLLLLLLLLLLLEDSGLGSGSGAGAVGCSSITVAAVAGIGTASCSTASCCSVAVEVGSVGAGACSAGAGSRSA